MSYNRRGLAPWSIAREAGIESATVDSKIDVTQLVRPTLDVGFIDEIGQWKGIVASDEQFNIMQTDVDVANTTAILTPSTNPDGSWPLDMTGYSTLFFALKTTEGGNYAVKAVMGPQSSAFANLSPVNAAAALRGTRGTSQDFDELIVDGSDSMTANVWNIYRIQDTLANQKLLQFQITNNSGSQATIETAFMRMV